MNTFFLCRSGLAIRAPEGSLRRLGRGLIEKYPKPKSETLRKVSCFNGSGNYRMNVALPWDCLLFGRLLIGLVQNINIGYVNDQMKFGLRVKITSR